MRGASVVFTASTVNAMDPKHYFKAKTLVPFCTDTGRSYPAGTEVAVIHGAPDHQSGKLPKDYTAFYIEVKIENGTACPDYAGTFVDAECLDHIPGVR